MTESDTVATQLLQDYGIRVLPSDTKDSPQVLLDLFFLLKNTLSTKTVKQLKSFRFVQSSSEKDPEEEISSYDFNRKSILVPGISFDRRLETKRKEKIKMIAALAHEIGHAFLFQHLSAHELIQVGNRFGGWRYTLKDAQESSTVRAEIFFRPHPANVEASTYFISNNISSGYALEDIHEWFAESFAAFLLTKLGKKGLLGKNWRQSITIRPKRKNEYWVNYNNISPEFIFWFERKIATS